MINKHFSFTDFHYLSRRSLYENIKIVASQFTGSVLDIGCGTRPYEHLFVTDKYVGLEVEGDGRLTSFADATYDGKTLPFPDDYFDNVLSFQVLEHVENIEDTLAEIFRVCKSGGNVLITMPFMWPEHEMPYDFRRLTSEGIKKQLLAAEFRIVHYEKSCSGNSALIALWLDYLSTSAMSRYKFFRLFIRAMVATPLNLFFTKFCASKNKSELFLDHVLICQPKK